MVFFFLLLFSLRQMLVSTMYIIIIEKKRPLRVSIQKSSHLVESDGSVLSTNLISESLIKPGWPAVWK